jgi:excisionase family DNA binding protein
VSGRLLTIEEVAARLGVSAKTVRRRVDGGELPVFRSGRVVRVREEDLRRYVAHSTARRRLVAGGVPLGGSRPVGKLWDPVP